MVNEFDYIIVGNGILGIHISRKLQALGKSYVILEKSRNVGGRFSSRRFDEYNFNFGVRSFIWDNFFFKEEIDIGLASGDLIMKEDEVFAKDTFNVWTKKLAKELRVKHCEVKEVLKRDDSLIEVHSSCEMLLCKNLIITAPAPQAYQILNSHKYNFLKDVVYKHESFYMCESNDKDLCDDELELISKVESKNKYFYFFSIKFWSEKSREDLKLYFDSKLSVINSFAHKWRYSRVLNSVEYKQVDPNIFVLGDFYSSGIFGSYDSAKYFLNSI